jgi:hypothetical protein
VESRGIDAAMPHQPRLVGRVHDHDALLVAKALIRFDLVKLFDSAHLLFLPLALLLRRNVSGATVAAPSTVARKKGTTASRVLHNWRSLLN